MNMTQFSAMQQIGRPPNCIDHDTITVSELVIPQTNFLLSFRFILLLGLKSSKDLKTNTLIYSLEFLLVQTWYLKKKITQLKFAEQNIYAKNT